ncbi:MAG TPA: DinB family protein [Gemmatimonadaceae bacterium]|nr:DinB family protein [Gemmatimonadaceae bacterium]
MATVEPWLRGPVPEVIPELQSAAHALIHVREELGTLADLTSEELWLTPGGAASVGFHVRHIAGSLDRLLTYARGSALSPAQKATLAGERDATQPPNDVASLLEQAHAAIDSALDIVKAVSRDELFAPRTVGRAALPSTVFGLICHAAEHAVRHSGQAVTTTKIIKGLGFARR